MRHPTPRVSQSAKQRVASTGYQLTDLDLRQAREIGAQAARAAGAILRSRVDSIREIRHKGAIDIVTDVDLLCEQEVCSTLLSAFPTHTILAEEGGVRGGNDRRYRWIVDPLDGTTNYAHGFPFYCVSIGLEVDGRLVLGVVYAPSLDELFVAEVGRGATVNDRPIQVSSIRELGEALTATGFPYERAEFSLALRSFEVISLHSQAVRRAGSAALDLCYVACGRLDGYWEHSIKPWDIAAGALIVLEAGGSLAGTDGSAFSVDAGHVLATNGLVHPPMLAALAGLQ